MSRPQSVVDLFWVAVWTILLSLNALCGIAGPMSPGQDRIIARFPNFLQRLRARNDRSDRSRSHLINQLNDPRRRRANEI
jgi:hypothetical protein